jgi:hypothetical protein
MNYAEDRLDRRARQGGGGDLRADYDLAIQTGDHELLGRTLRDNGWNRHAIFHYACHWMTHPDDWRAAADYSQMIELSGYSFNALLALLAYRNKSPLLDLSNHSLEREREKVAPDVAWLNQTPEEMVGRHCGCGWMGCGQHVCFDCIVDHSSVIAAINDYVQSAPARYADNGQVPTANQIHHQISLGHDIVVEAEPPIPSLLTLWANSDDDATAAQYRAFSPLLQMFAIKLLFLTIPSLAIETVVCTDLEVTTDWKSHRAFYIFVKALSLGERIKPHRIASLDYWHVPLWDRLWGRNGGTILNSLGIGCQGLDPKLAWQNACEGWVSTLPRAIPDPVYVLGDSHVLSIAWQTGVVHGRPRVFVPVLVTGLKAWHTRRQTQFFTNTCLRRSIERIPPGSMIMISAGEIDCREGMGGPLLEGYTDNCLHHVQTTVKEYVNVLASFQRPMFVLPVAPHLQRTAKGRALGQASRRQTMRVWNQQLRRSLGPCDNLAFLDYVEHLSSSCDPDQDFCLRKVFNADGTHLNSAFLPLLIEAISETTLWTDE